MGEHAANPYVLVLAICDQIYADPASGKRSLLGMFSCLTVRKLPAFLPQMAVYAAMTDGHGKTPVQLRIIDAAGANDPIIDLAFEVEFQDPFMIAEIGLQVGNVTFPTAGEYRLQATAHGELLMERRILVQVVEAPNV